MVRQEIYGYLLTRYAISALICKAATEAGIDPDRVKFKRTVRIVRLPSTTSQGASLARGASGSRGRYLAEGVVPHHQRPCRRARRSGGLGPRPLGDRKPPSLGPRRHLPGRQIPGQNRERTPGDGLAAGNLAISLLRLDGHANIAAANRHHARDPSARSCCSRPHKRLCRIPVRHPDSCGFRVAHRGRQMHPPGAPP
jgi:hypothetical protein